MRIDRVGYGRKLMFETPSTSEQSLLDMDFAKDQLEKNIKHKNHNEHIFQSYESQFTPSQCLPIVTVSQKPHV